MSSHGHHGNYYDLVNSQAQSSQGYIYQQSASATQYPSQATNTYQPAGQHIYNAKNGSSQYRSGLQSQQPDASYNNAPVVNNFASPAYNSTGANSSRRDQTLPRPNIGSNRSQSQSQAQAQTQSQTFRPANTSELSSLTQATQTNGTPSATFGRLSIPDQARNASTYMDNNSYYLYGSSNNTVSYDPVTSITASNRSYETANSQAQAQAAHSNSPMQNVQSRLKQQHAGTNSASRPTGQQPFPQVTHLQAQSATQRQQSNSVEPSPGTVDPSHVYDNRMERQRQTPIETARRKKIEDARLAREAEEAAQKAEKNRLESEERAAEEAAKKAEKEAKKKAEATAQQQVAQAEKRKTREEKRKSTSAASALQQLASSGNNRAAAEDDGTPLNDEEVEMRAMFKKMREFNSRNPTMLAKLWEEERNTHQAQTSPPTKTVVPAVAPTKKAKSRVTAPPTLPPAPTPEAINPAPTPVSKLSSASTTGGPNDTPATTKKRAQSPAAGRAVWPAAKKTSVSASAAQWLNALPANQSRGKSITKEDLMAFLDNNPTYVQLCEYLERVGLRFERSALARELLAEVPEGAQAPPTEMTGKAIKTKTAKTAAGKTQPATSGASAMTVDYQVPPLFQSTANPATVSNGSIGTAVMPPTPFPPSTSTAYQSPALALPSSASQDALPLIVTVEPPRSPPKAPSQPPADKEEAARKRSFNDLVDLTAMDDGSEDEGPPRKMPAYGLDSAASANVPQQAQQNDTFRQPVPYHQFMRQPMAPPSQTVAYQSLPTTNGPPLAGPPAPPYIPYTTRLDKPVPKPPLPSALQAKAQKAQQERMRGRMLVEPIMRDRVARKSTYDSRTIARDVLLAAGRHPDMRALNGHLAVMQKLLSDHGGATDHSGNKSDLGTIRWDLIDPGEVPKDETGDAVKDDLDADDEDETPLDLNSAARPGSHRRSIGFEDTINAQPPVKKRRKRCPRDPYAALHTPVIANSGSMPPSNGAIGYAAFRARDADGNVIKKRGRPVGWRKNIHSREAQGLEPAKANSKSFGDSSAAARQSKLVQPHYSVFRCGWEDCSAELHNLDTLKKHIVKLHGEPNERLGVHECLWFGCKFSTLHVDENRRETHAPDGEAATFATLQGWMDHVDAEHVQAVAWKLGDGPKSDHTPQNSDAYLSDAQGRSVTPVIMPATSLDMMLEQHSLDGGSTHGSGTRGKSRGYGRGHHSAANGSTAAELKAAAQIDKLTKQKILTGIIMGQHGCKLATTHRRMGFLDDEDFEDFISDSD